MAVVTTFCSTFMQRAVEFTTRIINSPTWTSGCKVLEAAKGRTVSLVCAVAKSSRDKVTRLTSLNYSFRSINKDVKQLTRGTAYSAGLDLSVISIAKSNDNMTMYETGVSVAIPTGCVGLLVPRSSIVKTGYILTNSVGIIDSDYRGTIKVCLTKIDPSLPNLTLPTRVAQLIIVPYISLGTLRCDSLDKTVTRSGGFGSTG